MITPKDLSLIKEMFFIEWTINGASVIWKKISLSKERREKKLL